MRFRANDAAPLDETWPHLLQGEAFNSERKQFEECRDEAAEQIKQKGTIDYDRNESLHQACLQLFLKFEEECTSKLKEPDGPRPQEYAEARHFLNSLQFQVYRFVKSDYQGERYQFKGQQLSELVDHMGMCGLYFADPQAGDEPTYHRLFKSLQTAYQRQLRFDQEQVK